MKNSGGTLNCFFFFTLCVCAIYHCQTTAAIKIMRNRFVTFNWLDRLTQNYELKSGEKVSLGEILEKMKDVRFTVKGKEVCAIVREVFGNWCYCSPPEN